MLYQKLQEIRQRLSINRRQRAMSIINYNNAVQSDKKIGIASYAGKACHLMSYLKRKEQI